jgi:hypothetical protein
VSALQALVDEETMLQKMMNASLNFKNRHMEDEFLESQVYFMLTYAHVCTRMLTSFSSRRSFHADVCSRMLTYADEFLESQVYLMRG